MIVVDAFPFWKELDILELRLQELYPVVDYFLIVESPWTFTGVPKPLYYQENQDRFTWWSDKIIHYVDPGPTSGGHDGRAWQEDHRQRNLIAQVPHLLPAWYAPDLWVMVSDVDEIPAAKDVAWARQQKKPSWFVHRFFYYWLNNESVELIRGAKLGPLWMVDSMTPHGFRVREDFEQHMVPSGWHFSCLGSPELLREKLAAFAHVEFDKPPYTDVAYLAQAMESGVDFLGREHLGWHWVEVDDTYPQAVTKDLARWSPLIHRGNGISDHAPSI